MAKKINSKYKIGTKFEDVDKGKIVWRYEIEAVSKNLDTVRGNQYVYLIAIYYEELDENDEVFIQETYTMMSHEELKNVRHIVEVDSWTDDPFRYDEKAVKDKIKTEDKLIDKKYYSLFD